MKLPAKEISSFTADLVQINAAMDISELVGSHDIRLVRTSAQELEFEGAVAAIEAKAMAPYRR
jgi:hypothetical protein